METFPVVSNVILWIGLILQGVFLFLIARTVGQFLNRFQLSSKAVVRRKLEQGVQAPMFRETDHRGDAVALADFKGRHALLLFVDERCDTCKRVLGILPVLKSHYPQLPVLVISSTLKEMDLSALPGDVHLLHAPDVVDNYFIEKVPTVALVDSYGLLAEMQEIKEPEQLLGVLDGKMAKAG